MGARTGHPLSQLLSVSECGGCYKCLFPLTRCIPSAFCAPVPFFFSFTCGSHVVLWHALIGSHFVLGHTPTAAIFALLLSNHSSALLYWGKYSTERIERCKAGCLISSPPIHISCLKTCFNRTWRTDLPKGMCILVAVSVEHEEAPLMGGVRAVVMDSQYLIEPCGSGKSRLTHICRVDLK